MKESKVRMVRFRNVLVIFIMSLLIVACGGGGTESDTTPEVDSLGLAGTVVATSDMGVSAACPNGGVSIDSGIDVNQNGLLDEAEVNNTQELCHLDAANILADLQTLDSTEHCAGGGKSLSIGYDVDENGTLAGSEINQVLYFCDNTATANFASLLTQTLEIQPGEECTLGGRKTIMGIDLNRNQSVETAEITSVQYSCYNENEEIYGEFVGLCSASVADSYCYSSDSIDIHAGFETILPIARFMDDEQGGEFTLTLAEGSPEWLDLSISEMSTINVLENSQYSQYSETYHYYLINIDPRDIPQDLAGNSYDISFTVSDGLTELEFSFTLNIYEAFSASLERTQVTLQEGENAKEYIKVTFAEALSKETVDRLNGMNWNDRFLIQRFENGKWNDAQWSSDFMVSWLTTFYEGQTFGQIEVSTNNDLLPEEDKLYRVVVNLKLASVSYYTMIGYEVGAFELTITDDGDSAISATSEFVGQINEATYAGLPTYNADQGMIASESQFNAYDFTIRFDEPLPDDGSLQLEIENLSSSRTDVGFFCYSRSTYCNASQSFDVARGQVELTATIYVIADDVKEGDVSYKVDVGYSSDFHVDGIARTFVVTDDDPLPTLGFETQIYGINKNDGFVSLNVDLTGQTSEPVSFEVSSSDNQTLVEGTHFDFGVSMPITIPSFAESFTVPIIFYTDSLSGADDYDLNLEIRSVSESATLSSVNNEATVRLDNIQGLSMNISDYSVPLQNGAYQHRLIKQQIYLSADGYVYVIGAVTSDAVIHSQSALGNYDFFVAKFEPSGDYVWGRQFGTEGHDSSDQIYFNEDEGVTFIRDGYELFIVDGDGQVNTMTWNTNPTYSKDLRDVTIDSDGNTYLLVQYRYSYPDDDFDDASSNINLVKYDSNLSLSWSLSDFSDYYSAHGSYEFIYAHVSLSDNGQVFLSGNVSATSYFDETPFGGRDIAVFMIDPENASVKNYWRVGTEADELSSVLVASNNNSMLMQSSLPIGSSFNGEVIDGYNSTLLTRFSAENSGSLESSELLESSFLGGYVGIVRNFDGSLIKRDSLVTNGSNYKAIISSINDDLSVITESPELNVLPVSPFYAAEDGGYLFTDNNENVLKLTQYFTFRL